MLTSIRLKVLSALILLFSAVSNITTLANQPAAWEQKHLQLQQQRDDVFIQLEKIHTILVPRVKDEYPTLLTRLSLDSPEARETGYGLLPLLKENEPPLSVELAQSFYSLKWVEDRLYAELQNANELYNQLSKPTGLEDVVVRFEESLKRLRNLEDNLNYHAKWQKAVAQYPTYYRNKNELVAMARELHSLIVNDASPSQVAELRHQLLVKAAPFRLTRHLQILSGKGDEMILPVTVCTDIDDSNFLQAFKDGVQETFSLSAAARAEKFSVDLSWKLISADTLYPDGVPVRGTHIDMDTHYALFTGCTLVLTSGAVSLNAGVGSRIFLGTGPVSPRTLAHEFGHLLGFEDAYLRGYDGDPVDPYGVVIVEWSGLSSDLMGDSERGQISDEMIKRLISAYGSQSVP